MKARIENLSQILLVICLIATTITLYTPVMAWIHLLMLSSGCVRIVLFLNKRYQLPSIRTLNLLALLSGIVLAYFSIQLGLLLAMVNLLVMACALKMMLMRNTRDYFQLIISCGFLIGCGLIFQQSISFSLLYLVLIFLLLLSLACFISPSMPLKKITKQMAMMSIQALPIALLLFFVMPQIGPLWQMPASKSSRTGLTDNVTPGDIANLSQSSELAFRATFSGNIPAPHERYWRAIVLEHFDGKRWQVSPQRKSANRQYYRARKEFSPSLTGRYFEYEVLAAPSHQRWLFALDIATPNDSLSHSNIWQSHDYQLISSKPLVNRFRYSVRSYPDVALNQSLKSLDRRVNLQLPEQGNPRTQKWVKQLTDNVSDDRTLVNAIMSYFSQPNFKYTLQPNLMPTDPVDTFLFDEKAGFCSHYASAMTYALRLAGIPARMVTGYQGGEMREQDYMSIYQYDAHAWVEAWIDESGWQRFDPTAIVSPDRIQFGLETAMQEEGSFLMDAPFSLAKLKSIEWLNALRLALADLDYMWSKWVLGFNNQTQRDLLKVLLGKLTPERLALFGLSAFLIICTLIGLFYLPKWRQPPQPFATKYYQLALKELAKLNIHRSQSLPPIDFSQYVYQQTSVNVARHFERLTQLFINNMYAHQSIDKQDATAMKLTYQQLKQACRAAD